MGKSSRNADSVNRLDAQQLNSLVDLATVEFVAGQKYQNFGFYPDTEVGGGVWKAASGLDKSTNNGGTIVTIEALVAWRDAAIAAGGLTTTNLQANLSTLFAAGTGTGDGFIRVFISPISGWYNSEWFGVREGLGNGTNNLPAYNKINSVIAADGPAGSGGGECHFPQGFFEIPTTITMPNRVRWIGTGRSTIFRPKAGFTQDTMFYFVNGTSSMFNSTLEGCWIQVNNEAAIAHAVVAESWQENCGLRRVVINGFQNRGVVVRIGHGGAAYLRFDDIEIFGSNQVAATYGIEVQQVSSVGGFVFHLNGATITGGGATTKLGSAVKMVNDSLIADGFHTEFVANGIILDGVGKSSIRCATGSGNNVDNLITLSSTFTGSLSIDMAIPNGAVTTLRNNTNGRHLTGIISSYKTGLDFSPSTAKAWVCFSYDGTTLTIKDSLNVAAVGVNGTGDFSVQWDRDFINTDYCVVTNHNATTSRLALTKEIAKLVGVYRFATFEWTGASAGDAAIVNPSNVYVAAYSTVG